MPAQRSVNVALGGGGAKGLVHLGVLRALDELDCTISMLVGTSIGAIWAALLAKMIHRHRNKANPQRKAIEHLTKEAVSYNASLHKDIAFLGLLRRRLVKSARVERWLAVHLLDADRRKPFTFATLSVDLVITAADARTGESIVCSKSTTPDLEVYRAVRASMSIPAVFDPVVLELPDKGNGKRSVPCWDGGITGNCRFDLAVRHNSNPVIASSLTYRNEAKRYAGGAANILKVSDHVTDILLATVEATMYEGLSAAQRARVCLLHPPLSGLRTSSFRADTEKRKKAIAAAYAYAKRELSKHPALRSAQGNP